MKLRFISRILISLISIVLGFWTSLLVLGQFPVRGSKAHAEDSSASSDSEVYIKIGDAQVKRSLVAILPVKYQGTTPLPPRQGLLSLDLQASLNEDLQVSTYFTLISPKAFLEDTPENWKALNTDFLIRSYFDLNGDEITLEVKTYYMAKNILIFSKKYKGKTDQYRRIVHAYLNDLLLKLTGKEGMYLSRLVVASDRDGFTASRFKGKGSATGSSGKKSEDLDQGSKSREIYVMDWDGRNMERVTFHKSVSLSPNWSWDGKKIAYTAFVQSSETKMRNADLFIYELSTKKRSLVSYRPGINSGAFFSPDDRFLYVTLSKQENPDIFKLDLEGNELAQLTRGPLSALNVEPAVSPDGKKIAFSSSRRGPPQIFVMDADGGSGNEPKVLTDFNGVAAAGMYNSSPAWSPDGKRIAFAGRDKDHFDIFTMNQDGTDKKRIVQSYTRKGRAANNEDPCYSPDGRFIVYTSNRTGVSQIYISDVEGKEDRPITSDSHNYYRPKWSKNFEE